MTKAQKKRRSMSTADTRGALGSKLSFAAAEAYKLLRTNLSFSMPDAVGCKIIGVTSSLRGEGKSTTAINMAYTIAQSEQKVLLLEADLRLPTMAKYLKIPAKPGISNLLAGQCKGSEVLQHSGLLDNLWVITAGSTPPNPAEMLGSDQMTTTLRALAQSFDVIVVDLPPVTAVSDALLLSKELSGMVLVVRQDYCDRSSLDETIRRLKFAEAKILGFVMTDSTIQKKDYKYYNKYYKQYGD